MTRVVLATVLLTFLPGTVWPEHRVALLIGNASYGKHALPTPHADVRAVGDALSRVGFRTRVLFDLDGNRLRKALQDFAERVPTRGTALVYYAGYALQGEREGRQANFLLPFDAGAGSDKGVSITGVLELLSAQSGARRQMVLVDAAYRYPSAPAGLSLGLAPPGPLVANTFLGLGAPPGRVTERPTTSLSPMASSLTLLLDASMDLRQAVTSASGWSVCTLNPDASPTVPVSAAIAPPEKLRKGEHAGDEWVNARGMVFCWCPTSGDVRGFWMAKFELTRRESGLSPAKGMATDKNHPADMLPPSAIGSYLEALNATESKAGRLPSGWRYVLPTEAEWEHACRAGTTTRFYFGKERDTLTLHANFADKSLLGWGYTEDTLDDKTERLARVGTYRANPWGLHDMYGNVWEWVESPGKDWCARGGSWVSQASLCSSSSRRVFEERRARNFLGYRVVIRRR